MESFAIFQPANTFIDGQLDVFLNARASAAMAEVSGPLRAALVLYVLLYGIAILRGAISEPIMDFAVRSVKLALIYTLATTAAYSSFVTEPLFHGLPDTLARASGGETVGDVGAAFDQFFARAAYLADKIGKTATPLNLLPWIVAAVVCVVGALAAAVGFGVVMIAKVALALLVALGPIFIACALFDASRRFFFGWLSQGVNYLTLFALVLTLVQLVLDLVRSQWSSIDALDPVGGGLIFTALCILAGFFFLQMPVLAAGVAGGASAGLADFGRAAGLLGQGTPRANPLRSAPPPGASEGRVR